LTFEEWWKQNFKPSWDVTEYPDLTEAEIAKTALMFHGWALRYKGSILPPFCDAFPWIKGVVFFFPENPLITHRARCIVVSLINSFLIRHFNEKDSRPPLAVLDQILHLAKSFWPDEINEVLFSKKKTPVVSMLKALEVYLNHESDRRSKEPASLENVVPKRPMTFQCYFPDDDESDEEPVVVDEQWVESKWFRFRTDNELPPWYHYKYIRKVSQFQELMVRVASFDNFSFNEIEEFVVCPKWRCQYRVRRSKYYLQKYVDKTYPFGVKGDANAMRRSALAVSLLFTFHEDSFKLMSSADASIVGGELKMWSTAMEGEFGRAVYNAGSQINTLATHSRRNADLAQKAFDDWVSLKILNLSLMAYTVVNTTSTTFAALITHPMFTTFLGVLAGGTIAFVLYLGALFVVYKFINFLIGAPEDKKQKLSKKLVKAEEAQSDANYLLLRQKEKAKQMQRIQGKTKMVAQSFNENQQAKLAKLTSNNLPCRVVDTTSGVIKKGVSGHVLFIKGGVFVTNAHNFGESKPGDVLEIYVDKLTFEMDICKALADGKLFIDKAKDLAWGLHPTKFGSDITKYFGDVEFPQELTRIHSDPRWGMVIRPAKFMEAENVYLLRDNYHNEDVPLQGSFLRTQTGGEAGDCGLAYVDLNPRTTAFISGIHIAGNSDASLLSRITGEMIKEALAKFVIKSGEEHLLSAQSGFFQSSANPIITGSTGSFHGLKVEAKFEKPYRTPKVSQLQPTLFQEHEDGALFPDLFAPAMLSKTNGIDPVKIYCEKVAAKVVKEAPPEANCPEAWEGVFPKSTYGKTYYVLSYKQAVHECANYGLQPIDLKTSCGGRWVWMNIDKEKILEGEGHPELRREIAWIIRKLKSGRIPRQFWLACPKDEKRTKKKAADGSTRYFLIGSLAFQIVLRMYFGFFFAVHKESKGESENAVGIDPYSSEWHDLAVFLGAKQDALLIDTDIMHWDIRFPGAVAYRFMYQASLVYDKVPVLIGTLLIKATIHTFIVFDCWILAVDIMPSGCLLTATLNSDINSVCQKCISIRVNVPTRGKYFGDDSLLTCPSALFLKQLLELRLSMFGWVSTSSDKDDPIVRMRPINECSFLKRSFVQEASGRYIAPLAKESIYAMLSWVDARDRTELLIKMETNTHVALSEASLYGELFYNTLQSLLNARWSKVDPSRKSVLSYHLVRRKVLNG
jgi:hypothetical protein